MRLVSAIRAALRAGLDALRLPGLARVQTAWTLGYVADTALTVLLAVVAFERFGPAGVALVGAARTLPATIVGLTAAAPMARWSAREVIIGIDVIRVGAAAGTALALATGAPPAWTFAVAAAMGVAAAIARPAHLTILPALARTPADLVAANVGTTSGEAIGSFIGPMTAAAFLLAGTPIAIAAVAAVAPALAIGGLLGLRFEDVASEREDRRRTDPGRGGGLRLAAGARALARRPAVAVVVAAFTLQTVVRGLLGPLIVVVSTELVGLGEPGVGYLTAALGVGGAIGMFAGLVLGRSDGRTFSLALAAWGAPIILIGLVPAAPVAIAALALVGLANALLDIIGFTILQRGSRNDERAPIFSILEGSVGLGTTIGSVAAPPLIVAIGAVPTLVATGAILPAGAVLVGLAFRRLGQTEIVAAATIDRLRAVPAFSVLPLTAIERLAGCGERVTFGPGESLMREGEPGDRFLLLESGTVEVTAAGKPLDRLGPGTGLGEIALLRGIPRTATITAIEPVVALAFDSQDFVTAVSGPAATAAATRMVEERLARTARDG